MARALSLVAVFSLLVDSSLALSAHSPKDLLAYPAYSIQLRPDLPISNSSAQRVLDSLKEAQGQDPNDLQLQLKTPQSQAQPNGGHVARSKPYLLRSSANGQTYLCSVPEKRHEQSKREADRHAVTPAERAARRKKVEDDRRQAYERGLSLLEPLKGHCLYLQQGWFTYAFCHGSEIRQFHAIRKQNQHGPTLAEDLTQEAYTLGYFSERIVEDEGVVDTKKARALGTLQEILESEDKEEDGTLDVYSVGDRDEVEGLGAEKRYLVQRWSGGTLCDKTGTNRKVEVQFHCNSQTTDRIFLIRETAICEYVIVIHTPRLCGEPVFVGSGIESGSGGRRSATSNVIECRPIVKDDVLLLAETNSNSQDTGAGMKTFTAMAEEILRQRLQPEGAAATGVQPNHEQPASQEDDTQDAPVTPGSSDEAVPTQQDFDENDVLDSFVLVLDPATGEVMLESERQGEPLTDMLTDVPGEDDEYNAMDEIMRLLQETLDVAVNPKQGENNPHIDTQKQTQQEAGKEPAAQNKGTRQDGKPPSRFSRSGSRNHKALAEQLLSGKLGNLKRPKGYKQLSASEMQQPPQALEIGTAQHRNMRRAFDTKWDTDEQKEKQEHVKDEL